MPRTHKVTLRELARHGAQARLAELEEERREILRAFPALDETKMNAIRKAQAARWQDKSLPEDKRRQVNAAAAERMRKTRAARKAKTLEEAREVFPVPPMPKTRADGKPLHDPRKQWTPEHRANWERAMRAKGWVPGGKKRAKRAEPPQQTASANPDEHKEGHKRAKRNGHKWTPEQRRNFARTMKARARQQKKSKLRTAAEARVPAL